ncbi:MAG: competence/damage-inducible protein A [Solirubrobacterales bacterium]|nr:competence/damage-inducible protein A [Solirubrobacterales bacterium]
MTRAGVLITGTEVLSARVRDRNGPWLAERLEELGIDLTQITIVGDRAGEMLAALRAMAVEGVDLIVTTGGLGPTADDLTTEVVGEFQGREMVVDRALEERIAAIVRPLAQRLGAEGSEAMEQGTRKQATVPRGATVLEPVGTAPGLVVPPTAPATRPTVVVLPGPPRELQPMWRHAIASEPFRAASVGAARREHRTLRLFGIAESQIAQTLRDAQARGIDLDALEITTCLRRGEVEVVTRFEPPAQRNYEELVALVRELHPRALFSEDGRSIDELLAAMLRGGDGRGGEGGVGAEGTRASDGGAARTIALAESCTGGLLAARLSDLPGASRYLLGAIVSYSNEVKVSELGVDPLLIDRCGAVSAEVARAMALGVRARLRADVGASVTGVAGPEGGTAEKPVGLVWLSVATSSEEAVLTRAVRLPGGRADVRERATTVAMHLIRRALLEAGAGAPDRAAGPGQADGAAGLGDTGGVGGLERVASSEERERGA